MAAEAVVELREEGYTKVLKCFAAQAYDLSKELMLAKLRTELGISDTRHQELRQQIEEGAEEPWRRKTNEANGHGARGYPPASNYHAADRPFDSRAAQRPRPGHDRYQQSAVDRLVPSASGSVRPATATQPPSSPFLAAAHRPASGAKRNAPSSANGIRQGKPPKRPKKDPYGDPSPPPEQYRLPSAPHPAVGHDIDKLIGYKIERYWPENGGWFEGAITDYRPATGEHCIVYDLNTSDESFEWLNLSRAESHEYRLLEERINVIAHAPDVHAPPKAASHNAKAPPKKSAGGMSRGRGLSANRGRGRGDRVTPGQHLNGVQGFPHQDYDQPSYRPPVQSRPNGSARSHFTVVSSDEDDVYSNDSSSSS